MNSDNRQDSKPTCCNEYGSFFAEQCGNWKKNNIFILKFCELSNLEEESKQDSPNILLSLFCGAFILFHYLYDNVNFCNTVKEYQCIVCRWIAKENYFNFFIEKCGGANEKPFYSLEIFRFFLCGLGFSILGWVFTPILLILQLLVLLYDMLALLLVNLLNIFCFFAKAYFGSANVVS